MPPKQKASYYVLDRDVFDRACDQLDHHPTLDMFALEVNSQCAAYIAPFPEPNAFGVDAFSLNWAELERTHELYANPEWTQMQRLVDKVKQEKVRLMLVCPLWDCKWSRELEPLIERRIVVGGRIFHTPAGERMPPPRWKTQVLIVDGRRAGVGCPLGAGAQREELEPRVHARPHKRICLPHPPPPSPQPAAATAP